MLRTLTFAVVGILAVTMMAAVACSDDEPSEEEATAQLCSDLSALSVSLNALEGFNADTTVEDAEAARDDVNDALENVRSSAEDVADARVDDLDSAYDGVDQAVSDVSGDDTLGEAAASIVDDAAAALVAQEALFSSLGCA